VRLIAVLLLLSLVGCSFHMPRIGLPRVHRVTIQQGNVITQTMIDKLKPGMTRRQVTFIMGETVLKNSFNPDRWDYIYSVQIPNVGITKRRATLYFDGDLLAFFTGDYAPTEFSAPVVAPVEHSEASSETDAAPAAVEPS
jgi:outer membrane protein assembly factor BamE